VRPLSAIQCELFLSSLVPQPWLVEDDSAMYRHDADHDERQNYCRSVFGCKKGHADAHHRRTRPQSGMAGDVEQRSVPKRGACLSRLDSGVKMHIVPAVPIGMQAPLDTFRLETRLQRHSAGASVTDRVDEFQPMQM
jgi:hypothetical protein